jgi:ribosome-binding factor A
MTQELNEKLMRCEVEAIGEVVRDSQISGKTEQKATEMIAKKTVGKARRMMGITKGRTVNKEKIRKYNPEITESKYNNSDELSWDRTSTSSSTHPDPFNSYESMKGAPKYQDLTHAEARRVQELFERKKMLARKIKWLKNNQIIDPVRTVTKEMKNKEREERRAEKLNPPLVKTDAKDPIMERRISRIEFLMERDTAISRMRTEARKEKLETSAVMKMATPNIGSVITDPLKRHLQRRRVRVSLLMQQYLDELFTCNSAQIILDHLGGATISVDRVVAPSTRGVHDVYLRVSSDHPRDWIQKQLDILAPKIRSQIAVRVNYGYTPEFKFHILDNVDKFSKDRLMKLAGEARKKVDSELHRHFMKEMNWK